MSLKNIFYNFLTFVGSIIFTLLILEFIVFRLILPASFVPENEMQNNIIKFVPNQEGVFLEKDEVKTVVKINQNGWNSAHSEYIKEKSKKQRIAILGDSFVEALMVDFNNSMAEQLERNLENTEVYRFAISGAPLSQYLHMLRHEVINYKPDVVIFVLIHNDFDESWNAVHGRYTSSFMKVKIEDERVIAEVLPKDYESAWFEPIRQSATFRYLFYTQKVDLGYLKRLILAPKDDCKKHFQANIDVSDIDSKMQNNKIVVDYIFNQINKISKKLDFKPIFIIDGDRNSIYENQEMNSKALKLNKLSQEIAEKYKMTFIDLQPVFKEDYQKNKRKFNYEIDGHWNEYGHQIATQELIKVLKK